jgi:hypothetical protein
MEDTPLRTPPKLKKNLSRIISTSVKKDRKFSDTKDIIDIEMETTEKKKPKLKCYEDVSTHNHNFELKPEVV